AAQEKSDVRLVPELPFNAEHSIHCAVTVANLPWCQHLSWSPIVARQCAQAPTAQRSGELCAILRIHNSSGKEELLRHNEDGGILQEERAALWEDDFEALIDLHLRIVCSDLAEIRIESCIQGERIVDDEFGIEAQLLFDLFLRPGCRIEVTVVRVHRIRNELNVAPWRDVFVDLHRRELSYKLWQFLVRDKRPHRELVVALDRACEANVPDLL